ncbi:glycosyltransferase family 4 protein [Halobacterium salinarum]|uniref:glycosyltransferase family 4 protein n=1 Tax=Halobacterium salinarum TaxID=2242 RepID=UPI0025562109|nr:glycosyltransferase family 4 protein [Halobacterium salinarum]MDL0131627.1 glycosyltransferase family 4 protein [Halobacterium salinarum]
MNRSTDTEKSITVKEDGEEDGSECSLAVLVLAEDFYPTTSGGAFIDWNVAKYLVNCGDDVTVVTARTAETERREVTNGVKIRRPFSGLQKNTSPNSLYGQLQRILFALLVYPYLIWLMWCQDYDVIYSTNHLFHPIAGVLRALFRIPLVTFVGYSPSIHEDVSLTDPLVLLERLNFRFFMGDRALCQTPSVREELERLSAATTMRIDGTVQKQSVLHAIQNDADEQAAPATEESTIRLVYAGRLSSLKQPLKVVSLLDELPEEYELVMVGDGPQRDDVEEMVRNRQLENRIDLTGRLAHEETLQTIYDSDLLLLPSRADAYPAVVFEALSLNTPVLATPVGVLPTIDHPLLTTADLSAFEDVLPVIDLETDDEIAEETLDRFSVDRFTWDVRAHLVAVTE